MGSFQEMLKEFNIEYKMNHQLEKNSNLIENSNSRIVGLLRKYLEEGDSWIHKYQQVIFALNSTSLKYGTTIITPNGLLNNRNLKAIPWADQDLDQVLCKKAQTIRRIMDEVTQARKLDTPSLSANILQRKDFSINQEVLVWREFVLKKRLTGTGELQMKLRKFWSIGQVISKSDDSYVVKMADNGDLRRLNKRQMKSLPSNFHTENQESTAPIES